MNIGNLDYFAREPARHLAIYPGRQGYLQFRANYGKRLSSIWRVVESGTSQADLMTQLPRTSQQSSDHDPRLSLAKLFQQLDQPDAAVPIGFLAGKNVQVCLEQTGGRRSVAAFPQNNDTLL